MKKLVNLILAIALIAGFTACEQEEEVVYIFPNLKLIRNIVGDFVEVTSYGLEEQVKNATKVANESISNPAETYQESMVNSYEGEYGYYNYTMSYVATQLETGIDFQSSADGEYETPYITSDDDINNNWILTEIAGENDFYLIGGSSTRQGYQYSKIYEDSFKSNIVLSFDNLEINRVTNKIKKGKIVFTYVGESSYGETYSKNGVVEYSDYSTVISFDE